MHPKRKNNIVKNSFSTGADLLDELVGGGESKGFPAGRIVNFVGDKSSGKTFLALEVIAAAKQKYKDKLKWVYDDSESGFSFDTKRLYGFEIMPINKDDRIKSDTVETAYCNVRKFFSSLSENQFGIYVIDSMDGLSSKQMNQLADEQYKSFISDKDEKEKGSYKMGKAKYLSDTFFPQLADLIETKNGLLIIVSQVRTNIDPMSFEKFTRAGGKALDFYCHTVLWLANINKIKRKDRPVGVTVKAKNTKSKTPRPYRECYLTIYFDYGLDNISTNIDFLFDLRTPSGQLQKEKVITWDAESDISIMEIKEFLQETKKEAYYRKNIHPKIKKEEFLEWLNEDKQKSLLKKYNIKYSSKMKRDELVTHIENNGLQNELSKRTVDKWEAIEMSIASNRPRKYL